ncbi:hypothetical protein GCM10017688_01450 [Streptomyces ramulosus]
MVHTEAEFVRRAVNLPGPWCVLCVRALPPAGPLAGGSGPELPVLPAPHPTRTTLPRRLRQPFKEGRYVVAPRNGLERPGPGLGPDPG